MRLTYMPYYCLSGVLLLLSSPPIGLWPLIFVAFIPLINGLEAEFRIGHLTYGRAFLKGYITGLFYAVAIFFWIVHVSVWALLPVTFVLACLHGLLAIGIFLGLKTGLKGAVLSLWTACLWVSLEVLGSDVFFLLPSYAIGYLVWKFPFFIQLADITGVFGVSFWIITVNILLARWWRDGLRSNLIWATTTLCITLVIIGCGYLKYNSEQGISVKNSPVMVNLVHSAVKAEEKRDPALKKELFESFKQLTRDSLTSQTKSPDLFVWPETSVPVFLRSIREKEVVEGLLQVARDTKSSIVLGARSVAKDDAGELKRFNAAFLVPPKGYIAQEYHKMLLAPGVEMAPLYSFLPDKFKQHWPSRMEAGQEPGLMTLDTENTFGIFICWEVFFPDFVRQLAHEGAGFLVNITNDEAAFGAITPAYPIPLPQAVYRAVENRRFLVRSANWGPSMFISPQGEVLQSSPVGTAGVLSGAVMPNYEQTFFTRYGYILAKGLFFITVAGLIILLLIRMYKSQ